MRTHPSRRGAPPPRRSTLGSPSRASALAGATSLALACTSTWLDPRGALAAEPPAPAPPTAPHASVPPLEARRAPDAPAAPKSASPFDKKIGGSGYAVAVTGAYSGVGLGGRLRWEMFRFFGVELFGEGLLVESRAGVRHDYPVGFHLFSPFRLGERVRLRPLAGMCAAFSFVEPSAPGGVRADDVLFGVHGGVGLEVALASFLSAFVDAKGTTYLGHGRTTQGYTGDVGEKLEPYVLAQGSLGLSLHL